jgi:hypothetical protein
MNMELFATANDTVRNIAVAVFLLVQIFSLVMYIVIRYHCSRFSLPRDKGIRIINLFLTGGLAIFAIAVSVFLILYLKP